MTDLISRQSVIDLLKKSASRDIEEVVITEKHINLIKDMPKAQCECEKTKTNADAIRSMTDEELARALTEDTACKMCEYWGKEIDSCNAPFSFVCTKGYAEALILKWLQSEAE